MTPPKRARPRGARTPAAPAAADPGLPLGSTGRTHPPLGLGLWALGRWTPEDEQRTRTVLEHAVERGMTWVDTAEVYGAGRSERVLGDVMARLGPRAETLFVVTKLSWEHLRGPQVKAALIGSLQRLGRRTVDLYLVHAPDRHVPIGETMAALEALWADGRTRAIGVSNFSLAELEAARSALSKTEVVVNQVRWNLLDHADADELREYCRTHQIVLEAYTPLARGLLAGRYLDGGAVPEEVRRFADQPIEGEGFSGVVRRARALRDLAKSAGLPMASLALHWLRRQGGAPVFGASRPEQVDRVLAAWATPPPPEVLDRADEIARAGA